MALRNQPYFPLYAQDYMTNTDLNMCSWLTQGIYIKILCTLHKQKEYGCILFKQKDKQKLSTVKDFASILVKQIPCLIEDMIFAIEELVENDVLIIDGNKIYQSRMVKDGATSEARSNAGKKGGGNPALFKQKDKQTDKQNTEYEIEYTNENETKSKAKIVKKEPEIIFPFQSEIFKAAWFAWKAYKKTQYNFTYKATTSEQTALNKLKADSDNTESEAIEIINASIANGWKGFFKIEKTNGNGRGRVRDFEGDYQRKIAGADRIIDEMFGN